MRLFTLFLVTLLTTFRSYAYNDLHILDPRQGSSRKTGLITVPEIQVTPRGAYAEIELTFTVGAVSTQFSSTDSLEAVLNFDLPAGSFIHDSYLWLTPTVVVQADIIDRGRAISIYESIVRRRRDPSLLVKTATNSYQLNIFPLTTSFPRKVKLVYSVPFFWTDGRAVCPLPLELLKTSGTPPAFSLSLGSDAQFQSPILSETGYAPAGTVSIAPNQYQSFENLHVSYTAPLTNGVLLASQ